MHLVLYGSSQAREKAVNLLCNLKMVKREESTENPCEVKLTLSEPIKEISLIPLLRQSGIYGFRLIETND